MDSSTWDILKYGVTGCIVRNEERMNTWRIRFLLKTFIEKKRLCASIFVIPKCVVKIEVSEK